MPLPRDFDKPVLDKKRAVFSLVKPEVAKSLIMKYEWLPTFGRSIVKCYGLFYNFTDRYVDWTFYDLIGAVAFRRPYTLNSAKFVAGPDHASSVCVLQRGACVPNAPHNSSSYLISKAVKRLYRDTAYRFVIAYADEDAGEIGSVYQGSNWLYTGTTGGKAEFMYDGVRMDGRKARGYAKKRGLPRPSMNGPEFAGLSSLKHRYVTAAKNKRKLLKVESLPYPKRTEGMKKHNIALAKEGKEMTYYEP